MTCRSGLSCGRTLVLAAAIAVSATVRADVSRAIGTDELLELNADWLRTHEGHPIGVPRDFAWAARPRMEAGNEPGAFAAATGWGHVFWGKDTVGYPGQLQVRNFETYLCHGAERHWLRIQSGEVEGAVFRADFKDNEARPASNFKTEEGTSTVTFEVGRAFHFWPTTGRSRLPGGPLCGFLVLFEARVSGSSDNGANTAATGGYLIGAGADYWIDKMSPWDKFKTNKGVGLGRLKYVGKNWAWYGMSTATDDDLRRLRESGLLNNYPQ